MRLQRTSTIIFLLLLALLVFAGFFPSPLTIMLVASASSALVLVQVYAVLRDDAGAVKKKPHLGHYQAK